MVCSWRTRVLASARSPARRGPLVVQTDLLNETDHPSTWVLPCTTRLVGDNLLRVALPRGVAGNREDCEVMVDQSRAIDNARFVKALRPLPAAIISQIEDKLRLLVGL